jgi:Response regulator containing CheY-like receiver, AAA-type ATPase, and DNA-binding domains
VLKELSIEMDGMERRKILIVEPDKKLAKKIYLILRKDGLIANTTEQALESIRTIQKEHISVLVFDVDVQDMAWEVAVAIIKELEPGLPIIITSTHTRLISKPVSFVRNLFTTT